MSQQPHEQNKPRKGWGLKLWLARAELSGIVAKSKFCDAAESLSPRFVFLLRRHPKLASERFLRHSRRGAPSSIYPLSLLLELGAKDSVVQEVYEMYPEAAKEPVSQNSRSDFPLHLACQLGRFSPKVVEFLARAAPGFVSREDSCYHLPIHSILRNPHRSATVAEVKVLLDIYEGALEQECGFGTPVTVALKSHHTTRGVLELLMRRLSNSYQWADKLHIPADKVIKSENVRYIAKYDRNSTIALVYAEVFSVILPHIRTFSCLPCQWQPEAFLHLMRDLKVQPSLVDLSLHMPPSLLSKGADIHRAIQELLEENTGLKCLHIDFGYHPFNQHFNEQRQNIAGAIKSCLLALIKGLHYNISLEECYLSGDILTLILEDILREEFWKPLLRVLQKSNLTLKQVSFAHLRGTQVLPLEGELVRYWLGLNRYGRAQTSNPYFTIQNMIALMQNIVNETAQNELDRVNFLHGLLRECPGLWSTPA